jgi:hypothetical protein
MRSVRSSTSDIDIKATAPNEGTTPMTTQVIAPSESPFEYLQNLHSSSLAGVKGRASPAENIVIRKKPTTELSQDNFLKR